MPCLLPSCSGLTQVHSESHALFFRTKAEGHSSKSVQHPACLSAPWSKGVQTSVQQRLWLSAWWYLCTCFLGNVPGSAHTRLLQPREMMFMTIAAWGHGLGITIFVQHLLFKERVQQVTFKIICVSVCLSVSIYYVQKHHAPSNAWVFFSNLLLLQHRYQINSLVKVAECISAVLSSYRKVLLPCSATAWPFAII